MDATPMVVGGARVRADSRPYNQRAKFTEFYPNGLPAVYKMLQTPGSDGVCQTYLEDYLPVGLYINPPPKAKSFFSTNGGQNEPRKMGNIIPQRRIHLWTSDEVQSVCNSLRKIYWEHMKGMIRPFCWDDLWAYFDGHDIYQYGALNLWNVICHLYDENKLISMDAFREMAVHVGHWADEWITEDENKTRLQEWDESNGPLLRILDASDWKLLGEIQDDAMPMISSALKHRRSYLLSSEKSTNQTKRPNDLMSSCRANNLENWMAGEEVFTRNGLPSPHEAKSHKCSPASRNTPAPIFVQGGKHYFLPNECLPAPQHRNSSSEAVQALQKSAAAAGGNQNKHPKKTQVAHEGAAKSSNVFESRRKAQKHQSESSKKVQPSDESSSKVLSRTASFNKKVPKQQTWGKHSYSESPSNPGLPGNMSPEEESSKKQDSIEETSDKEAFNKDFPSKEQLKKETVQDSLPPIERHAPRFKRATTPSNVNGIGMQANDGNQPELLTPTRANKKIRGNPRALNGSPKQVSTLTKSLPASAVMGFSEIATGQDATAGEPQLSAHSPTDSSCPDSAVQGSG